MVEEITQERADCGNDRQTADFVPGRGKRSIDHVGGELERETRHQPARVLEPDRPLFDIVGVGRKHDADNPHDRLDGADRDDENRNDLDRERDVVCDLV